MKYLIALLLCVACLGCSNPRRDLMLDLDARKLVSKAVNTDIRFGRITYTDDGNSVTLEIVGYELAQEEIKAARDKVLLDVARMAAAIAAGVMLP